MNNPVSDPFSVGPLAHPRMRHRHTERRRLCTPCSMRLFTVQIPGWSGCQTRGSMTLASLNGVRPAGTLSRVGPGAKPKRNYPSTSRCQSSIQMGAADANMANRRCIMPEIAPIWIPSFVFAEDGIIEAR